MMEPLDFMDPEPPINVQQQMSEQKLAIVFDGPPSHESGRFVEVELDGASVSFGEWQENGEFWELVLPEPYARLAALEAKLAEYENDETPTRRELALVKRKLEAMGLAITESSEWFRSGKAGPWARVYEPSWDKLLSLATQSVDAVAQKQTND